MSKKDKNIEVVIEEHQVNGVITQEILIGKLSIGEITPDETKFIATLSDGEQFKVGSQDEGLEVILQQYHLHQS